MTALVRYADHWREFAQAVTGCKVKLTPGYGISSFSGSPPTISWDHECENREFSVPILLHEIGHALDPACHEITKYLTRYDMTWRDYKPTSVIFETERRAWNIAKAIAPSVGISIEVVRASEEYGMGYYRRMLADR